jgi:DNA-binding transcriptional ArsR family regulator
VVTDTEVKLAIYRATAASGVPPSADQLARDAGYPPDAVRQAYAQLAERRLLVLEPDGQTIRMAPPFSGVPTQHRVVSDGIAYFANCAWDALGIPAALRRPAEVRSRCEQSAQPLTLNVGSDGPPTVSWLFHCPIPAARWWQDIVFT